MDFRLLSYDEHRPGLLVEGADGANGGKVIDLGTAVGVTSTHDVLESWDELLPRLSALAAAGAPGDAPGLAEVTLRAPVPRPGAIFCANSNYADHVSEMSGRPLLDKATARGPYMFLKAPHAVADPGQVICKPADTTQLDWEVELGVVIARPGRGIAPDRAYDHVAGYVVLNELSARDLARPEEIKPFGMDELSAKSFDGGLPMGPWLTPRDAVADPMDLWLKLSVGDELMQDSSTKYMHFTIAEQIAFLSRQLTLRPGDVIATGTPAGVGRPRGRFLQHGEVVTAEIQGLGTLSNTIVWS